MYIRADCPKPPDPKSVTFYISTEGTPKEYFLKGDVLKYKCLGFNKGNQDCPNKPKMPKFYQWRTEDMAKSKKKIKLPKPPKDGPNEHLAQYFDKVSKGYFDNKNIFKGVAYRKSASILRRTTTKITLDNYDAIFGKGSMGTQLKCILEGNTFETCVGDRLKQ